MPKRNAVEPKAGTDVNTKLREILRDTHDMVRVLNQICDELKTANASLREANLCLDRINEGE